MPRDQRLIVKPTALVALGLLWLAATFTSLRFISDNMLLAIVIGLGISLLHWAALFAHHFGHALAARGTGYPMVGVRLWWWLATSLYSRDEPTLPPTIHIRRALGGPLASFAFFAAASLIAWALLSQDIGGWFLAGYAALDSLLIFGIGSLIPLGFNDGSTLIQWSRAQRNDRTA